MFARRHDLTVVIHPLSDNKTVAGQGERAVHFLWRNQSHYDYLEALPEDPAQRPACDEPAAKRQRTEKPPEKKSASRRRKAKTAKAGTTAKHNKAKKKPSYKRTKNEHGELTSPQKDF